MLGPSLQLGSVAGIPLRVHWSFSLLLLWVTLNNLALTGGNLAVALGSVVFLFLLFGCVVLHELGHSLTARHYGIATRSITLSPLGGVAALDASPKHWKEELWITIAGPAVNALIALLLIPVTVFVSFFSPVLAMPFTTPGSLVLMLLLANVVMVLFNLLPAFPMDGGRILRALLASRGNRLEATQLAAKIGKICAIALGLYGLFTSPFIVLIALFVYFAGEAERRAVEEEEKRRTWGFTRERPHCVSFGNSPARDLPVIVLGPDGSRRWHS